MARDIIDVSMFPDIIEEDSKRLEAILSRYTPEQIAAFEKLTEDSVIHGTAPFRLGCGPQRWYTKEGIQAQIDDWKRIHPDMNVGLLWYMSGIGRGGVPVMEKIVLTRKEPKNEPSE